MQEKLHVALPFNLVTRWRIFSDCLRSRPLPVHASESDSVVLISPAKLCSAICYLHCHYDWHYCRAYWNLDGRQLHPAAAFSACAGRHLEVLVHYYYHFRVPDCVSRNWADGCQWIASARRCQCHRHLDRFHARCHRWKRPLHSCLHGGRCCGVDWQSSDSTIQAA